MHIPKRTSLLIATSLSLLTVFICWSISSPLGSAPDDSFHAAQIWCAKGMASKNCKIISINGDRLTVEVPKISHDCFWNPKMTNASCTNDVRNLLPQQVSFGENDYPGGQYKILSFFVGSNPIGSLLQMRIFGGILAITLMIGVLTLANKKMQIAFSLSWVAVLNPHGLFFISSINPTGWSFISISTSWIFLYALLENDWKSKENIVRGAIISVFFFVSLLIGISSRWDTWVFLSATYAISFFIINTKKGWLSISRLAIIGSFLIVLVLFLSRFNPKMGYFLELSPIQNQSGMGTGQYLLYIFVHLLEFPAGVFGSDWGWGGLGGLYPSTPPVVGMVGLAVAMLIIINSTLRINKVQLIAVSAVALLILGATFQQQNIGRFLVGDMVAPRYIMGLVAIFLALCVLLSEDNANLITRKHFKYGVISALGITHSLALYSNLDRFISFGLGSTGTYKGLNQQDGWWWETSISPYTVWALGTLAFMFFIISIFNFCFSDSD